MRERFGHLYRYREGAVEVVCSRDRPAILGARLGQLRWLLVVVCLTASRQPPMRSARKVVGASRSARLATLGVSKAQALAWRPAVVAEREPVELLPLAALKRVKVLPLHLRSVGLHCPDQRRDTLHYAPASRLLDRLGIARP